MLNIIVYSSIAVLFNIFAHNLTSRLYENLGYQEKYQKTVTTLFIIGIFGIIMSKLVLKDNQQYNKSVVSMGLSIGGVLLIITAILANWENIEDDIRIVISGLAFVTLIYIAYKYDEISS